MIRFSILVLSGLAQVPQLTIRGLRMTIYMWLLNYIALIILDLIMKKVRVVWVCLEHMRMLFLMIRLLVMSVDF